MKVDVITRHSVPNYGSLLQTYATQKTIEKFGHECKIINYTRYDERYKELAKTLIKGKKWDKNFLTRFVYKTIQTSNYSRMYKKFKIYRKGFLKETNKEYGNIEELKNDTPQADVYCSGSDQIWGKIGTANYDEAYFLNFINDKNKKCIAYSSSFGKGKIDDELKNNLHGLLKKYDRILVREDTAKDIIQKQGFNNVEQVLDPTFLLTREEWLELSKKAKNKYSKYVLVYQLHDNKEFDNYAKEFAQKANLKLLRISPSIYHITRSGKLLYLPNQFEFLKYFNEAEYILTDSFHATAFSLIFNKKFVDILPGKTSTRITSILKVVGLEDRVLNNYNDFSYIEKEIDFTNCNKVLDKEREKSLKLFKEAIVGNTNNVDLLNKHYNCTGCRMCEQICPKKAITMVENEEGFIEPVIDKEKCINCGLCFKKCPQLNTVHIENKMDKQIVYAAKNKDELEQENSSSGGIFSALANYVIENNGFVYGASFDENLKLSHTRIDNKENLYKLRGSKYLQSNTKNTFMQVKKDLEADDMVLYVGTPCQIAGLRIFLGKDYEKLILVDLVCHGVPSQKLFDQYISWIEEKSNSKVKKYDFRSKEKNVWGLNLKIVFANGKTKYIPANLDSYYKSFLNGITYRECCYNCKYANINRIGDITLADYWGIEKQHPKFYDEKGVSAIIINTEKGRSLFKKIDEKLEYIETSLDKVKNDNKNLETPTKRPNNRDKVYINLDNKIFKKYIKEDLIYRKEIQDIIKDLIPVAIKKKLKKIKKGIG